MDASDFRGIISMCTKRLYVRTIGNVMLQDDFETSWEELNDGLKQWYVKVVERISKHT